jgi:hypothetical protein
MHLIHGVVKLCKTFCLYECWINDIKRTVTTIGEIEQREEGPHKEIPWWKHKGVESRKALIMSQTRAKISYSA